VYVADYDGDVLYLEADVSIDEPLAEEAETGTEAEAISDDNVTDCRCKGVSLYGKVKIVDVFPDFKVKIVDVFPDLKVKFVDVFPDSCGKWQIVDVFPDFTIQIVDVFPDFTIKLVDVFPGMP
ncbi:MAG: hypothetical protein LBU83_11135, partial [Bacteroidales bacterium]|nr:hypothetical protein [Bacteroidales bacterium]